MIVAFAQFFRFRSLLFLAATLPFYFIGLNRPTNPSVAGISSPGARPSLAGLHSSGAQPSLAGLSFPRAQPSLAGLPSTGAR